MFHNICCILFCLINNLNVHFNSKPRVQIEYNKIQYCIAAKDVKSGKELEIIKCDPHDYKQLWVLDSMKRWRPKKDLGLCVEVSGNIFSKMQNPRLKKCDGYKDQKWTYNKKGDYEISPDMERSVCVTYDTHSPSSGDAIELDHCNGKSEQGWKIVDPGNYDGPSSSGGKGGSSGGGGKVRNKWMKVREDLSIWKLKTCSCNMYVVYITFE